MSNGGGCSNGKSTGGKVRDNMGRWGRPFLVVVTFVFSIPWIWIPFNICNVKSRKNPIKTRHLNGSSVDLMNRQEITWRNSIGAHNRFLRAETDKLGAVRKLETQICFTVLIGSDYVWVLLILATIGQRM